MKGHVIKIIVYGDVQSQERPRFARRGNFVNTYDAPKSSMYKKHVAETCKLHKLEELIDSQIKVEIDVYRKIPKSTSKKQRVLIEEGLVLPTKKPDLDNYVKALLDGITTSEAIWKDDSLIVELTARKHYSDSPRAEITVIW